MAQRLRECSVLKEDPSSVLSTQTKQLTTATPAPGDPPPSLDSMRTAPTHAQNLHQTYIHI